MNTSLAGTIGIRLWHPGSSSAEYNRGKNKGAFTLKEP